MSIPELDVNERVTKDVSKLISPWKYPERKKYCLKGASIIDVVNGNIIANASVFTENGKISRIVVDNVAESDEYVTIDCSGKYLCPGLFDSHVHLQCVPGEADLMRLSFMPKNAAYMRVANNCENMLKRGFTSVRDCGGTDACVKNAIDEGIINGPRLLISGHALSQTGGHGHMVPRGLPGTAFDSCSCHMNNVGVVADGVDECYKAAREELRRGADFIKIMAGGGVASPSDKISHLQYCDDEMQAIVRVAKQFGTYVTAHSYTPESIKRCLRNGVRGIEHGNLLDEESAKLMAEKGCYLTPTLVTYKVMASDQFRSFLSPESQVKNQQVLKDGLNSLLLAKKHGVKVCYGSDLLGPLVGYQTQEFFIRGKVLSAHDVLLSATVTPAEMIGVADRLGQIKQGYLADILMLSKNPLDDITVFDEPEKYLDFVMKDGRIHYSSCSNIETDIKN